MAKELHRDEDASTSFIQEKCRTCEGPLENGLCGVCYELLGGRRRLRADVETRAPVTQAPCRRCLERAVDDVCEFLGGNRRDSVRSLINGDDDPAHRKEGAREISLYLNRWLEIHPSDRAVLDWLAKAKP